MSEESGRAIGGKARAKKLSPERRKQIAEKAAQTRWGSPVMKATHGSVDHPLKIGDLEIPCYVLEDGRRVLSLGGMIKSLGMSGGGAGGGEGDRLFNFASGKGISPFISSELLSRITTPIRFQAPTGGSTASGYEATILPDICDAILTARRAGKLMKQQEHIAHQAEVLVRGFARVGIIALVDEATGYQKERARDALAQILEAFVAKELQPYVKTVPADYYEHMFRLRGLPYPPEKAQYKPQYFGVLTNDIVYKRLAPGLLSELKSQAARDDKKGKLHQRLTSNIGHPKLREHLASVVTVMKLSRDYDDFTAKLDIVHPKYQETMALDFQGDGSDGQSS